MTSFVKKLTSNLGYLRRLDARDDNGHMIPCDPQPVMRIVAEVLEGWEETSDLGEYVRFVGRFAAQAVKRDGTIVEYVSRNMIMPSVVTDYICTMMEQENREVSIKNRTGVHFAPVEDMGSVQIIVDLYIKQPQSEKRSASGYEFDMRIVKANKTYNPLLAMTQGLGEFVPGAKIEGQAETLSLEDAATVSETLNDAVADSEAVPAEPSEPEQEHKAGKRGKHKEVA